MNCLILFYIISFLVNYSICGYYKFDPESMKIEVVKSDSYTIGIDEFGDTDIKNCSFISDTGLSINFTVGIETETYLKILQEPRFVNTVTHLGEEGVCKIIVGNVDENGPKSWNIVAYDELEDEYITGTFTVDFFNRSKIVEYQIRIMEGSSIFNHLILEDKKLTKCVLKLKEQDMELDLNSPKPPLMISKQDNDEPTEKRITSLGRQLCGFKIVNLSKALDDVRNFTLTATTDKGELYRERFVTRLNVRSPPGANNVQIKVVMGQKLELTCGSTIGASFCLFYNPQNVAVYTINCKHTIWSVTTDNLGFWKCYTGTDQDMSGLEFTYELIRTDGEYVETWINETSEFVNLGCRIANTKTTNALYCKMEAPNHLLFRLLDYSATERYTSIGTQLGQSICSMQITKPLQDFEKGVWKCEISRAYGGLTGGFIQVGQQIIPPYPRFLQLSTHINATLTIMCEVPYYSEYCSIKAPDGVIHVMQDITELRLGKCVHTIDPIQASDNGTWTCLFARQTGLPDDQIKVDITVAEVLQYSKSVEADMGDTVSLKCSSGGPAIRYCRFISPLGIGYQIRNEGGSDRISYYGRGFEYGDCGIQITNIQEYEKGQWTCITKLFTAKLEREEKEVTGEIILDITPSFISGANAGAIGIGTGIVALILSTVFVIFGIRKWRQRKHDEIISSPRSSTSTNSEVNENIILSLQTEDIEMTPRPLASSSSEI